MRSIVVSSTQTASEDALAEVGDALRNDPVGTSPDLLIVFASPHHRDGIEAIARGLRTDFAPGCLIGCTAQGLIADDREIESGPALVAFAASLPGVVVEPFHMQFEQEGETGRIRGLPFDSLGPAAGSSVLLLGDPFTFPMDVLLRIVNESCPGLPLFGGMASGGSFPGSNRLVLDDSVRDEGAVGLVLHGDVVLETVVSQGCRPVGTHFVVTKGKGNVVLELGGRPALTVLREVIDGADPDERELLGRALHVGRAIDEYKSTFSRGDFLVRSVVGLDEAAGSFAINDYIRPGQTVQFHVRDPASATQDLELLLAERTARFEEHPPKGALLFSCNGRGSHMFSEPNHDATRIRRAIPDLPVAGFFAAGEIGPVGGQNFLHGFTASMVFFCRPGDAT